MMTQKSAGGGAMGGKTARACDNCIRKRARWYCAADDAFLCQCCDGAVHSANPLSRRHERVRLKTASLKNLKEMGFSSKPTWHRGFTKKARTPRHGKAPSLSMRNPVRLVPDCGGDETSIEETEEQLLYRVPAYRTGSDGAQPPEVDHFHGFLPSEIDLAEFSADVESLLGKAFEDESFGMEMLGFRDYDVSERENSLSVKLEDDEKDGLLMAMAIVSEEGVCHVDADLSTFELNFDGYNSSAMSCGEEDDKNATEEKFEAKKRKGEPLLKLDHDAVITAWFSHGGSPPWTGERPDLSVVDCLGGVFAGGIDPNPYRDLMGVHVANGDPSLRKAKVTRYREKRRSRLFCKKIRYEVRKLNAEKRPRMKGRFVKRASFGLPNEQNILNNMLYTNR